MTLQQLRYVVMIEAKGTLSEAAKSLFITQPSLSEALNSLEGELGITIFRRNNKGMTLTQEGEEFLGYARQVLEQTELIEEKYMNKKPGKREFAVSCQHYSFAVEAFVDLLNNHKEDEYEFHLRETQTFALIQDVSKLRSEIGILYLNKFNETIIQRTLKENNLSFHPLFKATPHVFLGSHSPLANKKKITLEELDPYPRLSYEQTDRNSFYFSEEILSTRDVKKDLVVTDRATLFNLLIGMDGYTFSTGVISEELNGPNIVSIPLDVDDYMLIGYLTHDKTTLSPLAKEYIECLKAHTENS